MSFLNLPFWPAHRWTNANRRSSLCARKNFWAKASHFSNWAISRYSWSWLKCTSVCYGFRKRRTFSNGDFLASFSNFWEKKYFFFKSFFQKSGFEFDSCWLYNMVLLTHVPVGQGITTETVKMTELIIYE